MTPIYYQPSGKYEPSAPMVVFILVFILASIYGVICGWLFTEGGLSSEVDFNFFIIFLLLIIILNSHVASIVVKKCKIRNPEMVFKMGWIAACLGWVFFNTATRYIVVGDADSSFLEFIYARAMNGYPVKIIHSRGSILIFTAKWFVGITFWLFELLVVPWHFGFILRIEASCPFSEKTDTWHKGFVAPYLIASPPKNEIRKRLKQGETDLLLSIQPDKYRKNNIWDGGLASWRRSTLFISGMRDDDNYYWTSPALYLGWSKNKSFPLYLKIDYETVSSVIYRFGFDQEKKYADLLQKLGIGGDSTPNKT